MLASDQDGDVVAGARAMIRVLKGMGRDIHGLAEFLAAEIDGKANGRKFTEADLQAMYHRGYDDGRREAEQNGSIAFQSVGEPSWHDIATACAAHESRLRDDHERKFVHDMVRRTVHGGRLSEKQENWLRSIYARVS